MLSIDRLLTKIPAALRHPGCANIFDYSDTMDYRVASLLAMTAQLNNNRMYYN